MEIEVDVLQQHIDKGERYRCSHCPLALAIQPLFVPKIHVQWTRYPLTNPEAVVATDTGCMVSQLPESAAVFMLAFDGGKEVKPFKFKMSVLPGQEECLCK